MDNDLGWVTLEYREKYRSGDWYFAVGIIAIALAVGSVLIKNYLFAIFVLAAAVLVFFFSRRSPREYEVRITRRGIVLGEYIYPYESLKHYWIEESAPHYAGMPHLLLHSSRIFDPIIAIPLEDVPPERVRQALGRAIPEKHIKEPPYRAIMDRLGF